jgi:DNA-binding CsgD family transcriptional regulator
MRKSQSLSVEDAREVFRVVAECRELGDDWKRWRQHLLMRAVELVGARVGLGGEVPVISWTESVGQPQAQYGWACDEEAEQCREYWERGGGELGIRAAQRLGPIATFTRQQFLDDDEWYALPEMEEVFRPANIDGPILSRRLCGNLPGWGDGLVVLYGWSDRQPTERDRVVLELLHDEIAPLIGGPLAARGEPAPSDLPPRKRQVLECLLMGATDKQIAKALRLSRPTVSEYVSAILKHFEAPSRAELIAAFLQRHRPPQTTWLHRRYFPKE